MFPTIVTWQSSAGGTDVSPSSFYDMSSKRLLLLPAVSLVVLVSLSAVEMSSTRGLTLRTLMMFHTHHFPATGKVKTQKSRAILNFVNPLFPWILVRPQVPSYLHILSQNKTRTTSAKMDLLFLPACNTGIH